MHRVIGPAARATNHHETPQGPQRDACCLGAAPPPPHDRWRELSDCLGTNLFMFTDARASNARSSKYQLVTPIGSKHLAVVWKALPTGKAQSLRQRPLYAIFWQQMVSTPAPFSAGKNSFDAGGEGAGIRFRCP